MTATEKPITYIDEKINNSAGVYRCSKCNEADKKMYRGYEITNDFNALLKKEAFYICEFDAKLSFKYFFENKSKSKSKSKELNLFEVTT